MKLTIRWKRRNPDFFTDKFGEVHPVRNTLGYHSALIRGPEGEKIRKRARANLAAQARRRYERMSS